MGYTFNLIAAEKVYNREELRNLLQERCRQLDCRVNFDVENTLRVFDHQRVMGEDLLFELWDPVNDPECGFFMAFDQPIAGIYPWKPLNQRLDILGSILSLCLAHCQSVHFSSTDNPVLDIWETTETIKLEQVRARLQSAYDNADPRFPFVPELNLQIIP